MEEDYGKCATCHRPAIKFSSGHPECNFCWEWRKLGSAAANYWIDAIGRLFRNDGGSGPDSQDYITWARWGYKEEVEQALATLSKLAVAYQMEQQKHRGSFTEIDRYLIDGEVVSK